MRTRLIRFRKDGIFRETCGFLTPITDSGMTLTLVNHNLQLTANFGKSVEFSGFVTIHSACTCVATWR